MMNGGYLMVSKTDTKLYEKLNKALTLGKPVLWYEDENTCYYIDTITKSGTDIILTKGGKTITIENDGNITESGEIQNHLYLYEINQSDYSFSILLPFKLNHDEYDISSNDNLTDDLKSDLLKIFEFYNNFETSGFSQDSSNSCQLGKLNKSVNSLQIILIIVEYASGNDTIYTNTFTLVDGDITSVSGELLNSDLYIYFKEQLF